VAERHVAGAPRSLRRVPALDERQEVVFGVAEEHHPLFVARRTEVAGVVTVDAVGFGDDGGTGGDERSVTRLDVVGLEVTRPGGSNRAMKLSPNRSR
jgi:hypothetical protein